MAGEDLDHILLELCFVLERLSVVSLRFSTIILLALKVIGSRLFFHLTFREKELFLW